MQLPQPQLPPLREYLCPLQVLNADLAEQAYAKAIMLSEVAAAASSAPAPSSSVPAHLFLPEQGAVFSSSLALPVHGACLAQP